MKITQRLLFCFVFLLLGAKIALAQCPDTLQASFDVVGETRFCEGQEVPILNRSIADDGSFRYVWNYGDGSKNDTTNSRLDIRHTFNITDPCTGSSPASKIYTVTLKMSRRTDTSCYSIASKTFAITRRPKPTFTAVPNPACIDRPNVTFSNGTCPATNVTYNWQFGDATTGTADTSTLKNPSHRFSGIGTYNVTLSVISAVCGTGVFTDQVVVADSATAQANFTVPTPNCVPARVVFTNTSRNSTGSIWSITGGNTWTYANNSNANSRDLTLVFTKAGTYEVTLNTRNACGANKIWRSTSIVISDTPSVKMGAIAALCQNQSATPQIVAASTEGGLPTTYEWTFQNGTPATFSGRTPPAIAFSDTGWIKVVATNSCGKSSDSTRIVVNPQGNAVASVDNYPTNGCAPFTLTMRNTSQGAVSQTWTIVREDGSALLTSDTVIFKNNTSRTSRNPQIEFRTAGKYLVKLQITNACAGGNLWWQSQIIEVKTRPKITFDAVLPACPPVDVTFRVRVDSGNAPLSNVQFSMDSSGTITTFPTFDNLNFRFTTTGNFTAIASATNVCGNVSAQQIVQIKQSAQVSAMIQNLPTLRCAPFEISMKNTSVGAVSNRWTIQNLDNIPNSFLFKNGTTATSTEPKIEFLKRGRYIISLDIGNACGANPTWKSDTITVYEVPKIQLDTLQNIDCQPLSVSPRIRVLDDGGDGPLSILWTFEGGTPQTSTNLIPGSISFPNVGIAKIRLAATNRCSTVMDEKSINVLGRQNPQIALLKDTFCTSDPSFTLNIAPTGGILTVNGVLVPNNYVFNPSTFRDSVRLNYRVGVGRCADSTAKTVKIFGTNVSAGRDSVFCDTASAPFLLLGATPMGGTWTGIGVSPTGVFNPSIAGSGAHVLTYTFRESVAACPNSATRTMTINGRPKAQIVADSFACKGLITNINGANSSNSSNYNWDFGDGTSGSVSTVPHTYTRAGDFTIRLIVTSSASCRDTLTKPIVVNELPVAAVLLSNTEGCSGNRFYFKNRFIDAKTSYQWTFGNGQTARIAQPDSIIYTYTSLRDTTFKINLTATTRGCPMKDTSVFVRIFGKTRADFLPSLDTICAGQLVNFINLATNSRRFSWNFGNGVTVTDSLPPSQRYNSDSTTRTYTVRLIANGFCNADTLSRPIVVRAAKLRAFVDVGDSVRCFGQAILLRARTNDGAAITYRFEDGTTATGDSVIHKFPNVGRNTFTTFVTNGCEIDSLMRVITLLAAPSVKFDFSLPNACRPDSFQFKNRTTDGGAYRWQVSNGINANTADFAYTFPQSGNFKVKLTATNPTTGCTATDSTTITARLPLNLTAIEVTPPRCYAGLGSIFVKLDSLTSGVLPYRFALNDTIFNNTTGIFSNLIGPKSYVVRVRDANGCVAERTATLTSPPPFSVDAGGTQRIDLGDSVIVRAVANRTGNVRFQWQNTEGVACRTCAETWLRPFKNTFFTVIATDTTGCVATAKLLVEVNRTGRVFLPNVFSPNRDGANDAFYPQTDLSVKHIRQMNVFNRWGLQVFHKENFAPNVEALGWDGNDGKSPSAVYVWWLEVEYLDGETAILTGDVTLMR